MIIRVPTGRDARQAQAMRGNFIISVILVIAVVLLFGVQSRHGLGDPQVGNARRNPSMSRLVMLAISRASLDIRVRECGRW